MYNCSVCNKVFSRNYNRLRHEETHQRPEPEPEEPINPFSSCVVCGRVVRTKNLFDHCRNYHTPWTVPVCEDFNGICSPTNQHKPKKCPHCESFFLFDQPFRLHLLRHGLNRAQIGAAIHVSDLDIIYSLLIQIIIIFPYVLGF